MSINELDSKVNELRELRELRNLEAELKDEISSIEDEIKSEMLAKQVEVLEGTSCKVTWKTITTTRFDSAAFKIAHADLFSQYSKSTTSRRFVIS